MAFHLTFLAGFASLIGFAEKAYTAHSLTYDDTNSAERNEVSRKKKKDLANLHERREQGTVKKKNVLFSFFFS